MESLETLIYPKQYIIIENDDKKIYETINAEENMKPVDEYLWAVVSVITEKNVEGITYSLFQYDDERVGWINFENSLQIFRFPAESYRFIDQEIIDTEINEKMGINKDFRTHFQNKLVTIKSEIEYDGKRLFGAFVNKKFAGFHPVEYFEKMIDCNIELNESKFDSKDLYKYSSLQNPVNEKVYIKNPKMVHFFKENNLARVKVNSKEFYWVSLEGFESEIADINTDVDDNKTIEQKYMDDILYAVNQERQQSEEIVKTVLAAKKHIQTKYEKKKDIKMSHLRSSFINAKDKNGKLEERIKDLEQKLQSDKSTGLSDKETRKISKDLELAEKRLSQQKEYNERLEKQKDKYKSRMETVEEKLEKLNVQKNKYKDRVKKLEARLEKEQS